MASSGERRLLFDTRGKRKHVIRVVYAILALLMGTSLFLVVGPVNIAELIGNSSSTSSATAVLDEQAERIERRLVKNPDDEQLLLALTRARISAGNSQIEVGASGGSEPVSASAKEDFAVASTAWRRYLKQAGDEPNPTAAQLVAGTYFRLAETGSTTLGEIEANVAQAAAAQRIAAEAQPSLGSLSTLAIYEYFNGDFAAGDAASKQAVAEAAAKPEGKAIERQLDEYRKRAKKFTTQAKEYAKAQKKAGKTASKEVLENPFGGLGGTGGGLGE